jgi:hypothetical protein
VKAVQGIRAAARLFTTWSAGVRSADFLAKDRRLAAAPATARHHVERAYGMAMSSNYNTRPRAAEVLVSGARAHLVRRREIGRGAVCPRPHSGLTIARFMTTATRRLAIFGISIVVIAAAVGAYFFAGDGRAARKDPAKAGKSQQGVLITSAVVQPRVLELYEEVVGTIENVIDPTVGAEVAGRVTRVTGFTGKKVAKGELLAEIDAADFQIQQRSDQAEIGRLRACSSSRSAWSSAIRKLVGQGFISQNAIDDAVAQRNALRQQLTAARARHEQTGRSLTKARVVAPIDGESRRRSSPSATTSSWATRCSRWSGAGAARAPAAAEATAMRIKPGLKVLLSPPAAPERLLEARIDELKPTLRSQQPRDRRHRQDPRRRHDVPRRRHGERAHRHRTRCKARSWCPSRAWCCVPPARWSTRWRTASRASAWSRPGCARTAFSKCTKGLSAGRPSPLTAPAS